MENDNPKLLTITADLVKKDFELPETTSLITEEELKQVLAGRVSYLMEHNMEQLFAILYRLDVSEPKVHIALENHINIPSHIAIAELIIERQKQKAKTRMEYSSEEAEDEDVSLW